MIPIFHSSILIPTFLFFIFFRLSATEGPSTPEKPKIKSSSSSNIDLFAAGERKLPKPPVSATVTEKSIEKSIEKAIEKIEKIEKPIPVPIQIQSTPVSTGSSTQARTDSKTESKISGSEFISTPVPGPVPTIPVPSASASRNSMIELQAELLRLEAEKEQIEMDQLRLDEDKVSTKMYHFFSVCENIHLFLFFLLIQFFILSTLTFQFIIF